ncbi:MAG: hypothetical protein MMC33_006558 [Icmadophila ericetorum]|nr:hypothetical protein [Icmadophila ericetorum]
MAADKVLSFLDLPYDVRFTIYKLVYSDGSFQNEYIELTPSGCRRESHCIHERVSDHAGLLKTCRMINAEATPIFYGTPTFYFKPPEYRLDEEPVYPKHNVSGKFSLASFWEAIGIQNQLYVRRLDIEIEAGDCLLYSYCSGESIEYEKGVNWDGNSYGVVDYRPDGSPVIYMALCTPDGKGYWHSYPGGPVVNGIQLGDLLADAFTLIAQNHKLRSLFLRLEFDDAPTHLFRPPEESRLLRSLVQIKGLEEIGIMWGDDGSVEDAKCLKAYSDIQEQMEDRTRREPGWKRSIEVRLEED